MREREREEEIEGKREARLMHDAKCLQNVCKMPAKRLQNAFKMPAKCLPYAFIMMVSMYACAT